MMMLGAIGLAKFKALAVAAIRLMTEGNLVEPASAAILVAALGAPERFAGRKVAII